MSLSLIMKSSFRFISWWITMHLMHLWQWTMSLSLDYLVCSSISFIVLFLQIDLILCLFFLMYQVDSWGDLQDDSGNTLHIGKLEYKTKHGKKPGSFLDNVFPRDVKSALCLLVNLFLEQPKIKDKDSNISDSLMKLIMTSAVNEGLHANSFGKVISFVLQFIWIHLLYGFMS